MSFGGLILLFVVVPIIAVIVLAERGKIVPAAAGLGLLQGLAKIGFALFGASERHVPQGQPVASVAVSLMLIQGPVLIIFAVATYRGKLWGASGLVIIAILSALVSLVEGVKAVWLIPITLTYALAVGSRVRDTSGNVLMTRHRPRSSHCRQPNMALERTAGTARRG